MHRLVLGLLILPLLCLGCGSVVESESGQHFAEKNADIPSTSEVEATINDFERKAFGPGHRQVEACAYLTPRSLTEFVAATGAKPPTNLDAETFKKGCPVYLAIMGKGSSEVPKLNVESVSKEEYEGRYYLVVELEPEFPMAMNLAGTKIVTFGLAEAEKKAEEAERAK